MDVFLGRQPIFNSQEEVIAYELLYRSGKRGSSMVEEADGATIDVLVNSFINIGFDQVANGKLGFVNFTENLLLSNIAEYLDSNQIVIEILEDVPITPTIINRVKELKEMGFKIALDDFILEENVATYYDLFMLIDCLKVDFLLSPIEKCIEINQIVKSRFPHITLLAEKVETREQLDIAKIAGYKLFQGYFFEKPEVIATVDIPANTMHYFEIMSYLNDEEPNINELSTLIERDVSLSLKLLQLINATSNYSRHPIQSIKQAITRIGFIELRKWIYLLALRSNKGTLEKDSSIELIRSSLFRAKICERMAKETQKVKYSEAFLVGMFSLIDAILQRPLDMILQQLPFSDVISTTILGERTEYTIYLELSVALSRMDWELATELLESLNIHSIDLEKMHQEASEWANSAVFSK